jgi:hypothetical protein
MMQNTLQVSETPTRKYIPVVLSGVTTNVAAMNVSASIAKPPIKPPPD